MRFPDSIERLINGKAYENDGIGMSSSSVLIFDDCVLKISPAGKDSSETADVMRWLDGKLPVPKVLCYESDGENSYLLMSRVKGRMACDEYWMERPDELVKGLADALRMLWSVDTDGCPRIRDIDEEIRQARYIVENGLADTGNVEPTTYGEGGFRDPADLLSWLEDNRPDYDPVMSHGDFCLPNIFMEDGEITGFIDLDMAGVGDRWRDIALCYRRLRWNSEGAYGGKVYPDIRSMKLFDELGIEPDMEKIRYYLLLDELF